MTDFNTELKKLRELTGKLTENGYLIDRAEQWEFALDAVPDLVFIVNQSYKIKYINKALSVKLSVKKEDVVNKDCCNLFADEENICLCRRKFATSNLLNYDFENDKPLKETVDLGDIYVEKGLNGWFNFTRSSIFDDDGDLLGFICVLRDITDRVIALNKLKKSEENYRHLVKYAPSGIYEIDFKTNKFLNVNDVMCIKTGYTEEEILNNLTPFDLVTPAGKKYFEKRLEKIFAGEKPGTENVEFEAVRKDGTTLWVVLHIQYKYDENGNIVGATVVSHDIDERKRAELALQGSEKRYADLYNNAPDMFVSVETETALISRCNQKLADVLGYTKEEIIGQTIFFVYSDDSIEKAKETFHTFIETGKIKDVQMRLKKKDGSKLNVSLNVTAIRDEHGKIIRSRSSWRDITEQVKTQEALRKSEEKYRNIYNTAPLAFVVWDYDHKVMEWNQSAEKMFGYTKKEVEGKDFFGFIVPENVIEHVQEIVSTLKSGKDVISVNETLTKSGDVILCEWYNSVYHDCSGKPVGFISLASNITELREKENLIKSIFRASPSGMGLAKDRVIQWTNSRLRKMIGYNENELVNKDVRILYDSVEEYERVGEVKYNQIREKGYGYLETIWKRKDGKLMNILLSSAYVDETNHSKGVIFTATDITNWNNRNN